jgi:tRNA A37 threonylcarbamoyladenosine biosynthesis protein TsaE
MVVDTLLPKICTHDVYMCLDTSEWSTSRCVEIISYRGIECVGWRIQIRHIHMILKHIAHTHGRGYPSPKKSFRLDWWVCTHDVYMCLDTSERSTSRCVEIISYRGIECVCWRIQILHIHILLKHTAHTHGRGYPSPKKSFRRDWWVCTHDVYMCLDTSERSTSRCVEIISYRGIECVGWRIQILHIHILLKHTAHTHGRGYPSPKKSFRRDWWVCTHDVYMCLDTSEWSTSRCVEIISYRGIECVGWRIQILHIHIIPKHTAHTHGRGHPSPKKSLRLDWWVCTHDVYMCLDTSEWSTSRCVELNSYRSIQCVGWRIQILHIHIILKHTAHTHGRGYPSPKKSFRLDWWVCTHDVYICVCVLQNGVPIGVSN